MLEVFLDGHFFFHVSDVAPLEFVRWFSLPRAELLLINITISGVKSLFSFCQPFSFLLL